MKYICIILFLLTQISYADKKNPIEIIAETMEWNKQEGKAIATGKAKAIQGNIVIKADEIIALLDDNNNQKINKLLAKGNIQFSRDEQIATGNEAIYNLELDKIIITGNVKLKRDTNIIKGEKLVIDFITGLSKMEGSNENQKVKMKYITE